MPDFPSELVEAAAKALLGSGPLPTTWDESWDELPKHQRKELRAAGAAVLAAVLPLIRSADEKQATLDPREEWRVVDGENVVCRHAGFSAEWAEGQCRALVERFPGESWRIERRIAGGEWEAYCPPDTPMGSCSPRCGDARCEAVARSADAPQETPTHKETTMPATAPQDTFDPRHPHEPEIPPTFDAEGRCLVCGALLAAEAAGRSAERARLAEAVWDALGRVEAAYAPNSAFLATLSVRDALRATLGEETAGHEDPAGHGGTA